MKTEAAMSKIVVDMTSLEKTSSAIAAAIFSELLRLRDNIIGTPLPPPKEKIKKKGLKYHSEIDRVIHYYPSRKFYIAFAVESVAFLQSVTTSFAGRREIQYCPSCLSDVRTPQWPKH